MNTLVAAFLAVVLSAGVARAQLVSSNPDFANEGTAPYSCTLPKDNKKTTCNRWQGMNRLSGWQIKCVYQTDSMLMKLPGEGKEVYLDPPDTGCSMLFHENWADTRKWEAANQAKEQARRLKAGHIDQYVQVSQAGLHEFGACMVRDIGEEAGEGAGVNGHVNTGGIIASLIQWHPVGGPTVHAVLPNTKTRFGPQENPLVNVPKRASSCDFDLPETSTPGDEIGCENGVESRVAIYYGNGHIATSWGSPKMWGEFLDGFEGHSGTGAKYSTRATHETAGWPAYWTCYSAAMHLNPGFYVLRAEILPFFYNVAPVYNENGEVIDGDYVSDYIGYGALSDVHLSRVE